MSSPSDNLKKTKRQPLPRSSTNKGVIKKQLAAPDSNHHSHNIDSKTDKNHFKREHYESPHNDQPARPTMTSPSSPSPSSLPFSTIADQCLHKEIIEGIRREVKHNYNTNHRVTADSDLVTSMATRLAAVEKELLSAKREIIEKDTYIRKLEERLCHREQTEANNLRLSALQKQVDEMEEFLNDYGLVWVGKDSSSSPLPPHSSPSFSPLMLSSPTTLWSPNDSLSQYYQETAHFTIDFNLVVSNICSLNALAGEDCHRVTHTPTGAELTVPKPIPLALYSNGLLMFDGPFRPYTDPTTQEFIRDLTDGYFPSELKYSYPDGVPFKLTDKRYEEYYHAPHHYKLFPGTGQKLTDQTNSTPSPSSPSSTTTSTSHLKNWTPNPHSSPISVQTFLSKIPKNVIKSGRVINVHAGLTETLQGPNSQQITLVNTPVVKEIKQRLEFNEEEDSSRPHLGNLVTLRIKSENGETTYVLKMHSSDTIADIHKHLNNTKPVSQVGQSVLKSAFPRQSYTTMDATLQECGLCPSANLFLTAIK